jgi:hypothetical protein
MKFKFKSFRIPTRKRCLAVFTTKDPRKMDYTMVASPDMHFGPNWLAHYNRRYTDSGMGNVRLFKTAPKTSIWAARKV